MTITYGFRVKATQRLVKVEAIFVGHTHKANHVYKFVDDDWGLPFEVDSIDDLYRCIQTNPTKTESTEELPYWGGYNPSKDFEMVKITRTEVVELVDGQGITAL